MRQPDVVIAGAGLIGLTCALELQARGMSVTVLEQGAATRQASSAAAGMLAAHDPENPGTLTPLAEHSIALYPGFLQRVAALTGIIVPIETNWTLEPARQGDASPQHDLPQLEHDGFTRIAEESLDPRKLAAAVLAAARAAGIRLHEDTPVQQYASDASGVTLETPTGTIRADNYLDCTGAWSPMGARPAKGQMLRVAAPGALASAALGNIVIRTPQIYMVPRLDGTVIIGATVEDAGFDTANHDADIRELRNKAAALIPAMAIAPEVERWAGLRPDTPDHLPLLGQVSDRCFVAAGHYRNGILLAPGTAHVMSQLIQGQSQLVNLDAFTPNRFTSDNRLYALSRGIRPSVMTTAQRIHYNGG